MAKTKLAKEKTSKKTTATTYNSDSIKTYEGTVAIRKRYGMYIGSGGAEGVTQLFYEALENAIDEFQANRATKITVKLDARDSSIEITDNGIGIPQDKIESCCTELHSSGKFENEYSRFSSGLHGVGLTVINALSENLTMIARRDGYVWKQTFSRGKVTSELTKEAKLTKKDSTGTTVSFTPDISILDDITLDIDKYLDILTLSAYMNKGLTYDFIGYYEDGTKVEKTLYSKGGLEDYIATLDNKLLLKKPLVFTDKYEYDEVIKKKVNDKIIEETTGNKIYMETEVFIQYSGHDTGIIMSFCNGLETKDGGSHETGLKMALTETFKKAVSESGILTKKDGNIEITPEDITEGIIALVNVKHSNAAFKGQTKDKLDVEEARWFVRKVVNENLVKWLNSNSSQAKIIYTRIIAAAKGRMAANRAKTAKKKEAGGIITGLSALSKVTLATNEDPKQRRMFIVEGDSAGSSVVDARCTETDTILKLKGKPLNTHDLTATRIEANKEFSDIITTLGCGIDNTFDISKLSHDQIICEADSDVDGFHISVLLATFFFKHMPQVISEGHFYLANAPLYKVIENGKTYFFNTERDYNYYIIDKVMDKYKIGRIVKTKDNRTILKSFTREEFEEFMEVTKLYMLRLNNIVSNAMDSSLVEFLANNTTTKLKSLKEKIMDNYPELYNTKIITKNDKKIIHVEGMIGNKYLVKDLDDEFYDSIADIVNIINEHNYKNLFYKKDNLKSKKVFIGELLHEVLAYGTPKHRQRFKGLGEMDYDELWYTTMRPDSNCIVQVKANDMKELAKVFEVQVGSDPVKRRIFLENFKIYPEDIDN